MREQLNNNPLVQLAVIGVLLLAGGVFALSTMGGGDEPAEDSSLSSAATPGEGPAPSPSEAPPPAASEAAPPVGAVPSGLATKPLPSPVVEAWTADLTVVLLFVHNGGIDDRLVRRATDRLAGMKGVRTFVVPAAEISRYAAITEGVGVDRVPALVVLGPKRLAGPVPTASVSYGFQDGDAIAQAVIDAGYSGPTVEYHP